MEHYVNSGGRPSVAGFINLFKKTSEFQKEPEVKIEFMGVWDTVAALGAPQLPPLDHVLNFLRRHMFYDYEPATCVKNVYHAIAVDDERRTFWPLVWDENSFQGGGTIEQVWFSGMHSNVGGGYARAELANVTLDWMIAKLGEHAESLPDQPSKSQKEAGSTAGLSLKPKATEDAEADANPYGKLYNSRSGLSIYYRYQPRPIQIRCADKLTGPIRIHKSVIDRLHMRTAGYTPGNLPAPGTFDVAVTRNSSSEKSTTSPTGEQRRHYETFRVKLDRLKNSRVTLYWTFLLSTLALVLASGFAWLYRPELAPPDCCSPSAVSRYEAWRAMNSWLAHLEDALRYVLPTFFDNAITYLVIQHPERLFVLLGYAVALYVLRVFLQRAMETFEARARLLMLKALGRPI